MVRRKRVFLSFRSEDRQRVNGLRLLAANPNYDLEFYDESVRVAIDSERAPYVRQVIREKIARTSVTVCLLSELTHTSSWVQWELEVSAEKQNTIIAMALKDAGISRVPPLLLTKRLSVHPWDPLMLGVLIQRAA
ncbi:MAG: TIR domain-containing protein [Gammaproteobacteria bacterium]